MDTASRWRITQSGDTMKTTARDYDGPLFRMIDTSGPRAKVKHVIPRLPISVKRDAFHSSAGGKHRASVTWLVVDAGGLVLGAYAHRHTAITWAREARIVAWSHQSPALNGEG